MFLSRLLDNPYPPPHSSVTSFVNSCLQLHGDPEKIAVFFLRWFGRRYMNLVPSSPHCNLLDLCGGLCFRNANSPSTQTTKHEILLVLAWRAERVLLLSERTIDFESPMALEQCSLIFTSFSRSYISKPDTLRSSKNNASSISMSTVR